MGFEPAAVTHRDSHDVVVEPQAEDLEEVQQHRAKVAADGTVALMLRARRMLEHGNDHEVQQKRFAWSAGRKRRDA